MGLESRMHGGLCSRFHQQIVNLNIHSERLCGSVDGLCLLNFWHGGSFYIFLPAKGRIGFR